MPGAHPGRWCCQRLRLGMVAAFLLAFSGLALLSQAMSQAGDPPFSPQTFAFFPSNDKLIVAATAPGADTQPLSVELLGADGKLVATGKRNGPRFELPADKAKADAYTLRVRQGQRRQDTPLKNALLASMSASGPVRRGERHIWSPCHGSEA